MSLKQKIRDVLAQLATLSEASAASLEPRASQGAPESSIPAGVSLRDRPPDKGDSLHDWWRWRFAEAVAKDESEFELYRLCLLAERDYAERRFRSPDRMALRSGELTVNAIDGGAAEDRQAERVVELYEGIPAVEVAVHEYTTEAWVKKARRQLGRDPQTGRPRPDFLDWDEDRRHREVATLAERMGKKAAAAKLRVDPGTVRRYWPEPVAA